MNRQKTLDTLYEIAKLIAEEMGLTETKVKEADCGLWDNESFTGCKTKMSDMLRKEYGEMKEITFHNGKKIERKYSNTWDKIVELRFRFANPVLCVQWHDDNGNQVMGSIELSDGVWVEDDLEHNDDYKLSEMMSWRPEGYKMTGRLMDMWRERGGE